MQVKEVNSHSHPAATVAGEDLELLQEERSDSGDPVSASHNSIYILPI